MPLSLFFLKLRSKKKTPRSIHCIPPNAQRSLATYSSFQHVGRQVLCFIGTFQGSDLLP